MDEIKIILAGLYATVFIYELLQYLQKADTKPTFVWLNKLMMKFDKPLGCQFCLGMWISLIIVLITLNPLYFMIFLLNLAVIKLRENG